MISGKLNQIRNLKNLRPSQVLSIQTDMNRGGRVNMSTGKYQMQLTLSIHQLFNCEAALGMQMSVIQSISQTFSNAYLFVQFSSIFYNSKSD